MTEFAILKQNGHSILDITLGNGFKISPVRSVANYSSPSGYHGAEMQQQELMF